MSSTEIFFLAGNNLIARCCYKLLVKDMILVAIHLDNMNTSVEGEPKVDKIMHYYLSRNNAHTRVFVVNVSCFHAEVQTAKNHDGSGLSIWGRGGDWGVHKRRVGARSAHPLLLIMI